MRLLLDSHVVLWWLDGSDRLAGQARAAIASGPAVFVSVATIWEMAIKRSIGKIVTDLDLAAEVAAEGFHALPITFRHAVAAGQLERHHRDPFDRMLVAQAQHEGLTIVTADRHIPKYDVRVLPAA